MVVVTGVILAGGQSRRMGRDKALIELGGQTLLQRTAAILYQITDDVLVVGPKERAAHLPGVPVVQDVREGAGPLGGIVTALQVSLRPYCLVVACDMPLLNADFLRYLIGLAPRFDVVVPRADGFTHQTHAVYSKSCLPYLQRHLVAGDFRLDHVFSEVCVRYVDADEIERFDPEHRSLMNINTPEDLVEVERLLAAGSGSDPSRKTAHRP